MKFAILLRSERYDPTLALFAQRVRAYQSGRSLRMRAADAGAKRGLWVDPKPIYPGDWRKAKRNGTLDALEGAQ